VVVLIVSIIIIIFCIIIITTITITITNSFPHPSFHTTTQLSQYSSPSSPQQGRKPLPITVSQG